MSSQIIYEHEVDFCCKRGKWKKCLCMIQIISRMDYTISAILKDCENQLTIDKIDLYGYECGVNTTEFIFIGKKDCYSIRFKDIEPMMELENCLKKYIGDISYFMKFVHCKRNDSDLRLDCWYRVHVQWFRICLTANLEKKVEIIKIWNIFQVSKVKRKDKSLSIEIKINQERNVYKFVHDTKKVVDKIYNALMEKTRLLPPAKIYQNHFVKRKSETYDLKRFNSCSNSSEMKSNNRVRTLSSSETANYYYDGSMSSTPASDLMNVYETESPDLTNVNEDAEPLVFQMDPIDCESVESNAEYDNAKRIKTDSVTYDSASSESESLKKVDLERFPYEAEIKNKTNTSSSSNLKDSYLQIDNTGMNSRPTNGKCYQTLSSLKSHQKTMSDVHLEGVHSKHPTIDEIKVDYCETNLLFSGNKCSSSSYLHTPSSSSNTSYETHTIPLTRFDNQPMAASKYGNRFISVPKYSNETNGHAKSNSLSNYTNTINYCVTNPVTHSEPGHTFPTNNDYYNMSPHFNIALKRPPKPVDNYVQNITNNNKYFNISDYIQSDPVDKKSTKIEDRKINYIELDFDHCSNIGNLKTITNNDNYKVIDIDKTLALKSLDGFKITKPQKKSTFRNWFKNN